MGDWKEIGKKEAKKRRAALMCICCVFKVFILCACDRLVRLIRARFHCSAGNASLV